MGATTGNRLGQREPGRLHGSPGAAPAGSPIFATLADVSHSGATAHRERLRQLALEAIENGLGDADLSPTVVAARVGVSCRYLHELFRDHGSTVGRWILRRRLERSRDELLDSAHRRSSIAAIALRNGFRDPSYFTRAFRREFGVTPRELAARGAALGVASARVPERRGRDGVLLA